jgi:antitoxin component YwqK of YwqJK toxin-antitoxin module
MKEHFAAIVFLFVINSQAFCQIADTIYYDNDWIQTSSKRYSYFRIVTDCEGLVCVSDYCRSGELQMTGTYKSFDFVDAVGPFRYYKKNKLTKLVLYQPFLYTDLLAEFEKELKYIKDTATVYSLSVTYGKQGRIKRIGFMSDECNRIGAWLFYFGRSDFPTYLVDIQNNEFNGRYIMYNKKGVPDIIGNYKMGKRHGQWDYLDNGQSFSTYYYENGKKIKTKL